MRAEECQTFNTGKRIRTETLGTLSLKLYRRDGDASLEASDHPLYRLLHDRPNPWTSAAQFIMMLESDTIMYGNGFAFANRIDGKIVELIRLNPLCVVVLYDVVTLEPRYQVSLQDGSQKVYQWQDILHVPSPNGLAAVKTAREAIGLAIALERHAAKILGNGARPSGVLKAKGKLNDTAYDRLKKSWKMGNGGENAGGTAILEDGTDFTPLTFSSVDLQFNEMRQFQVIEIGRALGIPPTLLFELGRATWANAEEMGQTFLTFTMLGRCKMWEGAISRLLAEDEQKEYFPEFLTDALVRANLTSRFAAFSQACGGPWLSPNEVRGIDNRTPIADGDKLRPPANATGVTPTPPRKSPDPMVSQKFNPNHDPHSGEFGAGDAVATLARALAKGAIAAVIAAALVSVVISAAGAYFVGSTIVSLFGKEVVPPWVDAKIVDGKSAYMDSLKEHLSNADWRRLCTEVIAKLSPSQVKELAEKVVAGLPKKPTPAPRPKPAMMAA